MQEELVKRKLNLQVTALTLKEGSGCCTYNNIKQTCCEYVFSYGG